MEVLGIIWDMLGQIYNWFSVYSPFSDRVGLPHHNTPFPGVLMKSIGAVFLRPNALPDVNHMRGMQYQIVLNIISCRKSTNTVDAGLNKISIFLAYTSQTFRIDKILERVGPNNVM